MKCFVPFLCVVALSSRAVAQHQVGDEVTVIRDTCTRIEIADQALKADFQARCDLCTSGRPYRGGPNE